MRSDERHVQLSKEEALDEGLAALLGWFEAAPLPESLVSMVEQLEAAYLESAVARTGTV